MKYLVLFFLLVSLQVRAQQDKDLRSLIEAERAFSQMSVERNTRDAFIYFFAPNSILIEEGKEVNGLEASKNRPADSTMLKWYPVYADIAGSKDFGWTTGPYQFFKNRQDTTPAGSGYYSSVWEKQPDGGWKVLFDLGSSVAEPQVPSLTTSSKPLMNQKNNLSQAAALSHVLEMDKKYIEDLNTKNTTFDKAFYSEEGRIHRPRTLPVIGTSAITGFKDPQEMVYSFKQLGGRSAKSGDMAFTYGLVDVLINRHGKNQNVNVRYFRIWKKEDGTWKIVLDIIG
jgi:ketosteroid isomerase-like protein